MINKRSGGVTRCSNEGQVCSHHFGSSQFVPTPFLLSLILDNIINFGQVKGNGNGTIYYW